MSRRESIWPPRASPISYVDKENDHQGGSSGEKSQGQGEEHMGESPWGTTRVNAEGALAVLSLFRHCMGQGERAVSLSFHRTLAQEEHPWRVQMQGQDTTSDGVL